MKQLLLNFLSYKAFDLVMLFITDIILPFLISVETDIIHKILSIITYLILKGLTF